MRYVQSKRISACSPFMRIRWPHSQVENASWPVNAWMRAAMNVSNENKEKSGVSKARYFTKSKKEVCGDIFVSSCRTCLPGNGSVSRLTMQLHVFLCRGMILLSICVENWKRPIITLGDNFWLLSQISVHCDMVDFVVDGHNLVSSVHWNTGSSVPPTMSHLVYAHTHRVYLIYYSTVVVRYVYIHYATHRTTLTLCKLFLAATVVC